MNLLLLIAWLVAIAALLWAVLLTALVHEHRRYVRATLRSEPPRWHRPPNVVVFVPCKGIDLELTENLRAILGQDYESYRVRFIVESESDPACDVIRPLMSGSAVPCELIVAGISSDSGQKVHNLRVATAELPSDIDALVFFDSDARPARDALARLVDCVCRGRKRVATGYRWLVPRRPSIANLTLVSINASVASLMKRQGLNLIWGGCWGITRQLFEQARIADAWQGTLSDDLVATRVLRIAGAEIVFQPGCMCQSSVDATWSQAVTFLRRQFVICRCYAPLWWWSTMPLMISQPLVLIGGLVVASLLMAAGSASWYLPLLVSAVLYGLGVLRAHWRQTTWSSRFPEERRALRTAAHFDRWATVWSCLFAVGAMLTSGVGRAITWRGVHYYIGGAGRVVLLGRAMNENQLQELAAGLEGRLAGEEVVQQAEAARVGVMNIVAEERAEGPASGMPAAAKRVA